MADNETIKSLGKEKNNAQEQGKNDESPAWAKERRLIPYTSFTTSHMNIDLYPIGGQA